MTATRPARSRILVLTALTLLLPLCVATPCRSQDGSHPPQAAVLLGEPGWYLVQVQQDLSSTVTPLLGLEIVSGRIDERLDLIVAALQSGAKPPPPEPEGPFPIDLNTAGVDLLKLLPGVGVAIAQRIVDLRAAKDGFFDSPMDLDAVRGITTIMVTDWTERNLVTVVPR